MKYISWIMGDSETGFFDNTYIRNNWLDLLKESIKISKVILCVLFDISCVEC